MRKSPNLTPTSVIYRSCYAMVQQVNDRPFLESSSKQYLYGGTTELMKPFHLFLGWLVYASVHPVCHHQPPEIVNLQPTARARKMHIIIYTYHSIHGNR